MLFSRSPLKEPSGHLQFREGFVLRIELSDVEGTRRVDVMAIHRSIYSKNGKMIRPIVGGPAFPWHGGDLLAPPSFAPSNRYGPRRFMDLEHEELVVQGNPEVQEPW